MAQPNPVTVHEVCKVAPPPTSPDSATKANSLPLTFFDLMFLRFPPVQRLFFYETSQSRTTFLGTVLPKLKHSLSATLQHYLPLAGNLIWRPDSDKPIIQYVEGDGISLTVAESESDFYHISGNSFREAKVLNLFIPNLLATETQAPVMALQVTLFPNIGFSIGYATHHAVLDGKTAANFMHTWAKICKEGEQETTLVPEVLIPFYDRTLIADPADLEKTYLNGWLETGPNYKSLVIMEMKPPPDAMLGTFHLPSSVIENIKKWVLTHLQQRHNKHYLHISSFTIISAYTWVCLVKARKVKAEKAHILINFDCRGRLKPPLPPTYFGNCISARILDADTNDLVGEEGVAIAAATISEALGGLNEGVLNGAENLFSEVFSVNMDALFSIAGSPRFELYKADFGWGRPRKVEVTSIDKTGAFSLTDCRDGIGGVEIGVVLKEHQIEDFASVFASGLQLHSSS